MNANTAAKIKMRNKIPKKKALMAMVVFLLVAAMIVIGIHYIKSKDVKNVTKQQTVAVTRGDLSVIVSGSGPISSTDEYDVTSNVDGTLTKIYFREGDRVKAGDLVFEIDDKNARIEIKEMENSIAQAKLSQEYNLKDLQSNEVVAPISGEVVDLQVKKGDNIGQNSTILTIEDKSKLKLTVPLNNPYRKDISIGQEVTVNALDATLMEYYTVKGKVSSVSEPAYKTNDGVEVYNVGVVIDNSGNLDEDMVANIEMSISGNYIKSKGGNPLSYINSMTIQSQSGGIVDKIHVENGQMVHKGDVLVKLHSDDLQLTTKTNELKLQGLEIQLELAKEKLLDYKIYSTIDGTFTLNDIEQGNSIKQGDILGTVANYDTMEFDIDIDELDIAQIKVGQSANVSIDALTETTDNPLKGTVAKIAIEGTSTDGVTIYPVTILLQKNMALKGGMNANAEIIVNEKKNALYLPIEAVQKKNGKSFVMVESNNTDNQESQRSVMKNVTTGISTDQYIEVVSGLNEGDLVLTTSASSTNDTQQNKQLGGMGMPPMDGGGGPRPTRN